MSDEKKILTKQEAIELVGGPREYIHTFVSGPMMALGADWAWDKFIEALDDADQIQLAGEVATRMKHPCAILKGGRWTFFEAINPSTTGTSEEG